MPTPDLTDRIAKTRAALARYRVLALVTGVFLLVLCVEMIVKYVLRAPDDLMAWIAWIPFAHGWVYVVYLVTVVDLWVKMRWGTGRLATMVLAGVVPVMSFVVEKKVHAEATALLDGAERAVAAGTSQTPGSTGASGSTAS
ncbi:DUF3817 domain-containing protein [Sanguibacter massiliensis]|uniref:DUF3817 domain-containing protein n=1 Tax=Sanguibacter massiliensis TaxID=1973217 RepID=UPI001F5CC40D|nr:DUF3817 domain-containing protein [Sanguibacter massiliensis]